MEYAENANILFKQESICSSMNTIKHVFSIFDFRACVYAKIKERGVMIHSRISFDGFENGIFQG